MAMLAINYYRKLSQAGLTLIEVLIALAIVGIAMTAIIKATSQNIRSTAYLQNKTIAMWVGQYTLNELRSGLIKSSDDADNLKQTINMLGSDWYWRAEESQTPNSRIKKITVQVLSSNNDQAVPLVTLESYRYTDKSSEQEHEE